VPRRSWKPIVARAKAIVDSYELPVTLRQLFYRLVVEALIDNSTYCYRRLSEVTAIARRAGAFPDLADLTREIVRYQTWADPTDAQDWLAEHYRIDRTEGQPYAVYLSIEKHALSTLLLDRFGDRGIPILPLGGYSSQTFVDDVVRDVEARRDDRRAILLLATDFDPSGEDLARDFEVRTGCFDKVIRVALTAEQVAEYQVPESVAPEKTDPDQTKDSRAKHFLGKYGRLRQAELDALPPDLLLTLFEDALVPFWDASAFEDACAREDDDRLDLA